MRDTGTRRGAAAAVACAVLCLLAPLARAGTLEEDLAACRALVEAEEWDRGEAAARAIFTAHENDPLVFGHLEEIEESLRLCMFRRARGAPTGEELFGAAARRFDAHTRQLTLQFGAPEGALWQSAGELHVLTVRVEGSFTLAWTGSLDDGGALLCYDLEKKGGYLIGAGVRLEGYKPRAASIRRLSTREGDVDTKTLAETFPKGETPMYGEFEVSRQGGSITYKQSGKQTCKATDGTYKNGYIALLRGAREIELKGKIDRDDLRSRTGEFLAAAYVEWTERSWNRVRELPEWVLLGPREVDAAPLEQWPADFPTMGRPRLNGLLRTYLEGRFEEFVKAADGLRGLPPHTALYLEGLVALADDRHKAAVLSFTKLLEAEPSFGVAQMYRAIARLELQDIPGALADLEAAEPHAAQYPAFHAARAAAQLVSGDIDACAATLAAASARGLADPEIDDLRGWVHRARRGPAWTSRFEHETEHFVVMSDHGKAMCYDVATALELQRKLYARAIGDVAGGAPKSRVYVFAGRDGYLDYSGDLSMDLTWTSGVYIPILRELCIWVPADKADLAHTVRHEGFHQYLHHFVERAPLWFNEGWAETFGATRGDERRADRSAWAEYVRHLIPVERLVRMPRPEFLKQAALCYAQSDDLVRFLRDTKERQFRGMLTDYLAALREGLSQEEAYARVFAPSIEALESAFKAYMRSGG